jgi:hypothetical protein
MTLHNLKRTHQAPVVSSAVRFKEDVVGPAIVVIKEEIEVRLQRCRPVSTSVRSKTLERVEAFLGGVKATSLALMAVLKRKVAVGLKVIGIFLSKGGPLT